MTFRIVRAGIHSQIFATDEEAHTDQDIFDGFRAAQQRLLRYLKDRRDRYNDVIHRIEHTTVKELGE